MRPAVKYQIFIACREKIRKLLLTRTNWQNLYFSFLDDIEGLDFKIPEVDLDVPDIDYKVEEEEIEITGLDL